MTEAPATRQIVATCHCGAVEIRLAAAPAQVTHCNCSLCRRYGALWTYVPLAGATFVKAGPTDTYAWGGRMWISTAAGPAVA